MPVYALVAPRPDDVEPLTAAIKASFVEGDRHSLRAGVWFVRSPHVTSDEVRDQLGIAVGGINGIVIAIVPGRVCGVADKTFVEKLQVWKVTE